MYVGNYTDLNNQDSMESKAVFFFLAQLSSFFKSWVTFMNSERLSKFLEVLMVSSA